MSKLGGKVAFITGVARGQGRSHALRLAGEGAAIIGVDLCESLPAVPYALASPSDLDETVRLVEEAGGKIFARTADVRDLAALTTVVDEGVGQFGRLDIIVANAGIVSYGDLTTMNEDLWQEMIDINLTGVWKTVRAAVRHIVERGEGGSVVLTSSTAGLRNMNTIGHYVVAKHGVTALAKALANELGPRGIRVNSVHPSNVRTPMLDNPGTRKLFRPDLEDPQLADVTDAFASTHLLDVPWLEPEDISNAILYLVSDEGRYVTGSPFVIDAGMVAK